MSLIALDQVPTPKMERWKFTNLPPKIKNLALSAAKMGFIARGNTQFVSHDTTAAWVRDMMDSTPAGAARYRDMMLWSAANNSFDQSVVIDVPANTQNDAPLTLTLSSKDNDYTVPHLFVRVGDNADFTIIEEHNGQGAFWNNALTQITLGKNARLRHYRMQDNSIESIYTQNTHVTIERDARYEAFALTTGGKLSRNQVHGELKAENGNCSLSGLNLIGAKQHADTTLLIEHLAAHCDSHQLYKTILKDDARGVFQGKIFVDKAAQKTNGYQLSNNILLSPLAEMNVKPELEIYADDVKCSHGSTTGQLDETPMFYLRSRGLSKAEARQLLLEAFIGDALDKITHEDIRSQFTEKAIAWLSRV